MEGSAVGTNQTWTALGKHFSYVLNQLWYLSYQKAVETPNYYVYIDESP